MSEQLIPLEGTWTIRGFRKPENGKVGTLTFDEYPNVAVKFWMSAPLAGDVEKGAKFKARIDMRENPGHTPNPEPWLAEWNGKGEKAAKGGSGGGYAPKPPIDAWASLAGSCIETSAKIHHGNNRGSTVEIVTTAKILFGAGYDMVQAALAGRVNK